MEKNVIVFADKFQGIDWYLDYENNTFIHQDKADLNQEKFWVEGTEIPEWVTEIATKEFGYSDYPELLSKYLKVQDFDATTFDIHFNDSGNSNNKGFKKSFDFCMDYIKRNSGSYFQDYPNGIIFIVCNETGSTVDAFTIKSNK